MDYEKYCEGNKEETMAESWKGQYLDRAFREEIYDNIFGKKVLTMNY